MSVGKLFFTIAGNNSNNIAQIYKKDNQYVQISFEELKENVLKIASFFHKIGIKAQDNIAVFSANRWEWAVTDFALLSLNAVNVPKGEDVTENEAKFIFESINPVLVIVEHKEHLNLLSEIANKPKKVLVFDFLEDKSAYDFEIYNFQEALKIGSENRKDELIISNAKNISPHSLATIIYTSGTTGVPKGVMISHGAFLYQVEVSKDVQTLKPNEKFLSILPIWHSFQRAFSYIALLRGTTIIYSNKIPKIALDDLKRQNPEYFPAVPRLWIAIHKSIMRDILKKPKIVQFLFKFFLNITILKDRAYRYLFHLYASFKPDYFFIFKKILSLVAFICFYPISLLGSILIFNKVKKVFGNNFKLGITGGGSISEDVLRFFNAIGIPLTCAYGLTEAAPCVAFNKENEIMIGVSGTAIRGTHLQIRDSNGNVLKKPGRGILYMKGPQLMLGYYKNKQASDEVLKDGWLNTGDIVQITKKNQIYVIGREKDTIVLNNGENVEPTPIEQKLEQSIYIDKAIVVGQDQRFLAALILPNFEAVLEFLKRSGIILSLNNKREIIMNSLVLKKIGEEISNLISRANGFKPFEQILKFKLLDKPFEIGREVSAKLDIRRNYVLKYYKNEILSLFG